MDRALAISVIKAFLAEYAALPPVNADEVEMGTICDDERGHYQLLMQGWDGARRLHGLIIHVDVRGDKIIVQHDGTRESVANRLVASGIPATNIVIGFHHPEMRQETPFAVA